MWAGRAASLVACLVTLSLGQPRAVAHPLVSEIAQALTPPVGFGLSTFAELPAGDLATSLTFGPGGRLYVTSVQGVAVGEGFEALGAGQVYAFDDEQGLVGGPPTLVADGLNQALGIVFGPDGTMYVSDDADNKGRIQAFSDKDGDGVYETHRTVLMDIPNGRHQTNGMAFGPDGMLYVTNGSATDDGTECGPEPVTALQCPTQEVKPWTGAILRVDPSWNNVDLLKDVVVDANGYDDPGVLDDDQVLAATGFRNIYDVDPRPGHPCWMYTPMNGSDNPASNEPLYRTNVCDTHVVGTDASGNPIQGPVIDDAGFPSCLYGQHENDFPMPNIGGHSHPENFEPEDNINPDTIAKFGPCQKDRVIRPIMFFAEAHNGVTGLAFERGDNFPDRYDGAMFVAEWGSLWNLNGAEASGHKITEVDLNDDGTVARRRTFMTGGAPMDVTFGPDGAMYVADFHGSIYRVASVMDTPDTAEIDIVNGQFVPQVVAIPHDTQVLWVNLDTVPHSIAADKAIIAGDPSEEPPLQDGTEIDSTGDIPPRGSWSHEFEDESGVWIFHSSSSDTDAATMHGAVIVAPAER